MQHMQTPNNNRFFVPQYELLGVVRCEEVVSGCLQIGCVAERKEGRLVNFLFLEIRFLLTYDAFSYYRVYANQTSAMAFDEKGLIGMGRIIYSGERECDRLPYGLSAMRGKICSRSISGLLLVSFFQYDGYHNTHIL